jgi:hypothetical protein
MGIGTYLELQLEYDEGRLHSSIKKDL